MSRFQQELRVIPRPAWITAGIGYLAVFIPLLIKSLFTHDPVWQGMPVGMRASLPIFPPLLMFAWVVLIGYVYGDARRRQMRYVMWTLLAILIPDGIGIILYFILREPLAKSCPGCARFLKAGFVFCPFCGTALQATCPNCGRGVEVIWPHCPQCGSKLPTTVAQAT